VVKQRKVWKGNLFGKGRCVEGFCAWNAFEVCEGCGGGRIIERHPTGLSFRECTMRERNTEGSRGRNVKRIKAKRQLNFEWRR
jgi:hypothetical protein